MAVSIRDVAEKANVSVGTVSKVLNDVPSRIPQSTRDHIRQVAAALGYSPNRLARSLGRRKSDTVGLMISGLRNPFFVDLAETAEELLLDAGYQVFLDAAPSQKGTYRQHGKLRGWPVDGVLMWASADESAADYLGPAAADMPVVYLGFLRPDDPESCVVAYDLYDGARQMAEHLVARGHGERGAGICCVVPVTPQEAAERPESLWRHARPRAFRDVCAAHGAPLEFISLPDFQETREAGYAVGREIAARPAAERPGAVFCHNDVVAVGLYRALRRAGLRVPEDIAVAGFDHTREGDYLDDPLTTVATPGGPVCRAAVGLLLRRLAASSTDAIPAGERQVLLPASLVVGGTT
jgi:DNA-binding LacI/PurR family transcriptional regulator